MARHGTFAGGGCEVEMAVRAWGLVVALALVGCGGSPPRDEPGRAPGGGAAGRAPAAGGGAVAGRTLHEAVKELARREGLTIAVDPRVDGPVDDALRARMAGRPWREQLELLAIAFDCVVKEQAPAAGGKPPVYLVTFEERADVAIHAGARTVFTLLGAWAGRKVSFDPTVPDTTLTVNEVGAHWRALFERLVRELGPYVIVEEGEHLEVVPLERKTAQDEGWMPPRVATGVVTAAQGEQLTLAPATGGEATTLRSPLTGSTHAERVHDFLATAAGRRGWAAVTVDAQGTITNAVVRTSARGK